MADNAVNIDDYIKGRMDESEAAAFETQMATDPALAAEVDSQSQVMNALEEAGDQEVQAQIAAISQDVQQPAPEEDTPLETTSPNTPPPQKGNAAIIKILLRLNGTTSEIIRLSYTFQQEVDNIGQPSGEVKGGTINLTLGSLGNAIRFGWAIQPDVRKNGSIDFIDANGKTLKTLTFQDAYCIAYTEKYTAFSDTKGIGKVNIKQSAQEQLTLSCRSISIGGETHLNTWLEN